MSQTTTTTLVRAFEPKHGTGKTGKPWTRSDFEFEGGLKASTFNGGVASTLAQGVGQKFEIEYEEEQNGQYTNRTLTKVSPVANGNGPAAPGESSLGETVVVGTERHASYDKSEQYRSKHQIIRTSALEQALTAFAVAQIDPLQAQDELFDLVHEYEQKIYDADNDFGLSE